MKRCPWAVLVLVLFLVLSVESRRHYKKVTQQEDLEEPHSKGSLRITDLHSTEKRPWEKYSDYQKKANVVEDEDDGAYCHKIALRRCGSSFMKVFQLFVFLPEEQAFQAKCALRTAFYSCLQKFSISPCTKPRRFRIEDRFRKRLAESLWSARACLLGMKPKHSALH